MIWKLVAECSVNCHFPVCVPDFRIITHVSTIKKIEICRNNWLVWCCFQRPFQRIPSVIRSDDSLKMLKPTERMCYFEGEKKLQFFKTYTKHNCDIEFLPILPRQLYSELCNCVPFNFPRDSITRLCGIDDLDSDCISHLIDDFKTSNSLEKMH